MGRYDDLGMRRVINAAATLTRLGGSVMPPPVVAAMVEGAAMHVDLPLLQARVGERIAALTQNEACYVSSGAAAGIAIAVAACIAGEDPAAIARFPYLTDGKREVIIHRAHRNGYDHAARQTGATLVEIGGAHITHPWELEAAISPRTACVLWFAGEHYARGALALAEVVAIAHAHDVPVLVDAAAQIPPISSLWHFTRALGADIAIFSGGKGLRGPQSSGLVLGRRDIVAACRVNGSPNHSLGRPMKVGKEETLGVLAAVEWSLAQDEEAVLAGYEETVQRWIAGLHDLPGITVTRGYPSEAGQPHARAIVRLAPDFPITRDAVVAALAGGSPCVAVGTVGEDAIALNPQSLVEPDEAAIVLEQVRAVLAPVAAR
ncbi:MAG: aminotransferase class V-fold PLP-dependent enzyme [Thermomicrobia bacterium]|nr:aminotransferase class V-fold PLP-dependent enzyme [Thermomicrobia bacterium]